jgi:hypothetical protein
MSLIDERGEWILAQCELQEMGKDFVLTISQNAILAEYTSENRETRHVHVIR